MITVTCPHCTKTRDVMAATALVASCVRCARRRRAESRTKPTQSLAHLVRRAADVVGSLRRLDAHGMAPNFRHASDLDAIERQIAALADSMWRRSMTESQEATI